MKHFMVDLETLGTTPGSVILSIGAVEFSRAGLGSEFYTVLNTEDCMDHYLAQEEGTKKWWGEQSHEARQVLRDAADVKTSVPLKLGLTKFSEFLGKQKRQIAVWGNGADFDNALLAVAYKMADIPMPWEFWNNRCYRTLKNLVPGPKLTRTGVYHNALDDAKSQAQHMVELMRGLPAASLEW